MCKYIYIYFFFKAQVAPDSGRHSFLALLWFMSLANFIKSAATQLDEVATWLLGKISSHLISLSSGSIIPANCICLAGAYLLPALSCLPLALSASTSFPATSLLLSLSLSFCSCFCLSTSASKLVINQLVASLTSCRIIFSRCKLTLHTHIDTHSYRWGIILSMPWPELSLLC